MGSPLGFEETRRRSARRSPSRERAGESPFGSNPMDPAHRSQLGLPATLSLVRQVRSESVTKVVVIPMTILLLGTKSIATRSKKLLGTKGIATRSKNLLQRIMEYHGRWKNHEILCKQGIVHFHDCWRGGTQKSSNTQHQHQNSSVIQSLKSFLQLPFSSQGVRTPNGCAST